MRVLALLALLLSTQAFATGGFDCATADKKIEVYGTTGRFYGNPLVGELTLVVDGVENKITKDLILGYWNSGDDLKILAIDSDYNEPQLELIVKRTLRGDKFKGKLKLKDQTVKITCEAE